MFPWFWFWAPQVHFPWSGAVTQRINPNLSWFSDLIEPGAGDPEVERKAFGAPPYHPVPPESMFLTTSGSPLRGSTTSKVT